MAMARSRPGDSELSIVDKPCFGQAEDHRCGDIIFDPFMGSGTTMIAAERNGRAGYGVELSPAYCDIIVARWEKFTGKTATLADAAQAAG